MERQTTFNIWYLALAIIAVIWLRNAWVSMSQVQSIPYSEHTAQAIDQAVLGIVDSVFKLALEVLTHNRQTLDQGAGLLFERETLTEVDLREISATLHPRALPFVGRGFA